MISHLGRMRRCAVASLGLLAAACSSGPTIGPQPPLVVEVVPVAPSAPAAPLVVATEPERPTDPRARIDRGVSQEPCRMADRLHSVTSDTSLFLDFRNDTDGTLSIDWIDFVGHRVHYADLAAGESYRQQTFVTHPWIVVDGDDQCRGVFIPHTAGIHEVVIPPR